MADFFSLPEFAKIVSGLAPSADAAGRTGNYVTCKNAHKVFVVFHINQGAANTILLSLNQATTVAGGSAKAVANNMAIWANEDASSGTGADTLTLTTNTNTYTTGAGTKEKLVIFELDPAAQLDTVNSFKDVAPVTGASSASNITSAQIYVISERYSGVNPPTAMTD